MDDDDLIPNNFFEELSKINDNLKKFDSDYLISKEFLEFLFYVKILITR